MPLATVNAPYTLNAAIKRIETTVTKYYFNIVRLMMSGTHPDQNLLIVL